MVSFHSGAVLTNLVVAFPDSKPHIFQNVEIETYKQDNNSYYYYISSITPSQQFNRRGAFRCFIGLPAVVQIGLEKHTQEATIKDISNTGFSILPYDSTVEYEIGTTIHLMLDDLVDENKEKYNFYLIGIVVRKHELENGNIVYGCRLNNKVPGLDSYIMLKERLRLSKSRNYN